MGIRLGQRSARVLTGLCLVAALLAGVLAQPAAADEAGSLAGRVTGNGQPIAATEVRVLTVGTETTIASVFAASDGRFSVAVPNGTYDVMVMPPDGSGYRVQTISSFAIIGATSLDIALVQGSQSVFSGVVRDSNGLPVPNVRVTLWDPTGNVPGGNGSTDADGRYGFGVLDGNFTLEIGGPSGNPAGLDIPTGSWSLARSGVVVSGNTIRDVTLPPTVGLTVTAIGPGGQPVPNASVEYGEGSIYNLPFDGTTTSYAYHGLPSRLTDANGQAHTRGFPDDNLIIGVVPPLGSFLARNTLRNINVTGNTQVVVVFVSTDPVPPVVIPIPSVLPNLNGWNTDGVSVALDCSDNYSGVVDCPTIPEFTEEGIHEVTLVVRDNAGNQTEVTVVVRIDRTAPTIVGDTDIAPNAAGWFSAAPTVLFDCDDAVSGIDPDGGCTAPVVIGEGDGQTVNGTAIDRAGHSASTSVAGLRADLTPPTVTAPPTPNANGWLNQPVSITCADALSGIATCDGQGTFGEGLATAVNVTAVDVAGHQVAVSHTLNIDLTAPTATITGLTNGSSYDYGSTITADFACHDALSGIDEGGSCTATLDGQVILPGATIDTTLIGSHTLVATATDAAGNTSSQSVTFIVRQPTTLVAHPMYTTQTGLTSLWHFSATLTTSLDGAGLAGRLVSFTAGTSVLCAAVTDAAGKATCNNLLAAPAAVLNLGFTATYAGDQNYMPATASGSLLG